MSKFVNLVTRYLAPAGLGFCMAATASAESFAGMAAMISLANVFAYFCVEAGRETLERTLAWVSGAFEARRAKTAG